MAPGIDPVPDPDRAGGPRTFRRSLSARLVSVIAVALFGLAVASRTASGDFGAGYVVLGALVLVSVAGVISAWGDRVVIDAAGVETRNVLLSRLPLPGLRPGRRFAWDDILRVQEHHRPGAGPADLPRALFLVPLQGRRLALDSLEDFDDVVRLVRALSTPPGGRPGSGAASPPGTA